MKYVPHVAARVMLIATVLAVVPLVGCIGPYRGASSSTTGSGSTLASHSTLSSHRTLASRATSASNSTFPLRSGSSSSSDPNVEIRRPLVVAQAPKAEQKPESETVAAAADAKSEVETAAAVAADPADWLYCRGPNYDGTSRVTGLPDSLEAELEENFVRWKRDDLGGRCTPTVMNGKLYVLVRAEPGTPREGEKVVCVDAATGETIWENRFNVWLSDVPDTRVGWSSVACDPETGNVYAQGVCGYFQCINGETGETIWSVPMHERFGLLSTYGGRTNFPIVVGDQVITSAIVIGWGAMAKPAHRFIGFDKRNGDVLWFNGTRELPYDTTYSAPALAVVEGAQQLVFGSGDGDVWGMQPLTGKTLWNYKFSMRGINTSPMVVDEVVYAGHSEENVPREGFAPSMGGLAAIKANLTGDVTKSGEIWRVEEMMIGKSAPLVVDGVVYAFDDRAKLWMFDAKTGEQVGRRMALGTVMRANPLYADGKIYAITAGSSRWYVLKPVPDSPGDVDTISKGRFPNGEEVQGSPIAAQGRIYVMSSGGLYCFEDSDKEHGLAPAGKQPAITPVGAGDEPALVQVVPAELLMEPGRIVTFKARLFNSRGQFLREAEAEFSLDGPGEMTPDGTYLSPTEGHVAADIHAKVGDLEGSARVRIVPPLPWEFDFTGLKEPPVTWVGARYRHVIRDVDGDNVMVKVTTIPKGTRSRAWFGPSDLSNYTIQADVRGARTDNKMPDIGLTAQGYALDLQGASQKLEIRTWVTQRRIAKAVDYAWEPDTWYTMKLQAQVVDAKDSPTGKRAILKGKIWPRDEKEPDEWTVTTTDDSPNLSGSPGLYGNAKDAEIFLDNIRVYANDQSAE